MESIQHLHAIFLKHPEVCTDSRKAVPNSLFFALKGDQFDGNKFVSQVLEQGCAWAISDDRENEHLDRCIIVDNVLATLQQLAHFHRQQFDIPVFAITGTNGKTTTKELLYKVMSTQFNTLATQGNLNNHIGVPLTLLRINEQTQFAIIEMGANHLNEIAFLCEIAQPTHGMITNVGKAHLEGFGSFDGVRAAKKELYDFLEQRPSGIVFINRDDAELSKMYGTKPSTKAFYYNKERFQIQENKQLFLQFSIQHKLITTQLVGSYNLDNVLAAYVIGGYFGITIENRIEAIASYRPENNRSQYFQLNTNHVILDAYNANPSSMAVAIENFHQLQQQNKILILGDMLELGDDSGKEHLNVLRLTKNKSFQQVLLVGPEFKAQYSNTNEFQNTICVETVAELTEYLKTHPIDDAYLLIKASRGMGLERIVNC